MRKILAVIAVILGVTFGVAACSTNADNAITIPETAVLIDVRTPEEYNEGHLEGAELLDLNSGEFAAALPELDKETEYYIYCRSGNRSAEAMQMMVDQDFKTVTDLGGMENAAAITHLPIVK